MNAKTMFADLEGEDFDTYKDLLGGIKRIYTTYKKHIPVEITSRDLLHIACKQGWVGREADGKIRINVSQTLSP